ncbi:GreA/GreB family elongation factor [Ulvibacterium sp.]|uniref:GreA/GreB family elongation factor n=1 Tax=Ulvibacterium sp. TaxID=2665914 RepID=UPI00260D110E|nr:GreA/GreB family elongation factor [Ulvibacterium sp.]
MKGITKEELLAFCEAFVVDRITRIRKNMLNIREALDSETKSSAGDKHETARSMLQLEREKLGRQLAKAEEMKYVVARINLKDSMETIGLGSCITTSKGNYFLAISAGAFTKKDLSVFCISIGTPIGRLLLGKTVGDTVVFNGQKIEILAIE